MDVATARDYFEKSVPALLETRSDQLHLIDAVYEFQLTGDNGGTWTVNLKHNPMGVREGAADTADCTVVMDADAFVKMLNGSISPQMAFLNGQLKVTGNMGLALKLTQLF